MENASEALIIGGTILIAIMILSIGVYLFVNYARVGESYEETRITAEITKFNAKFTTFAERTDITAQEIITLKNFAKNYEKENEITVIVNYPNSSMNDIEFLSKYSLNSDNKTIKYFECKETNIGYDNITGRVNTITFTE